MIPYIIKAALILAGCLAFYKVLLRRETFYKMNRYVLITCLIISFTLPFVPVPQQLSMRKTQKEVPVILQKNWPVTEKQSVSTQPGSQQSDNQHQGREEHCGRS